MSDKLSIFQQAMLSWNALHPYNVVHIVRIARPLHSDRLTAIINSHLEQAGLTGLILDLDSRRFHYRGGPAHISLAVLPASPDPWDALLREIQTQINTRFVIEPHIEPFRFFVVPDADAFYLGLAYCHFISSGESVVPVFKNMILQYQDESSAVPVPRLNPYAPVGRKLVFAAIKYALPWILHLPSHMVKLLTASRPAYHNRDDHRVAFTYFRLNPDEFLPLTHAAKSWGVTLNDVFLAALLKSVAPLAVKRIRHFCRKKIAVASIVNVRRDLCDDNQQKFGLFLGSFIVNHAVPDSISLPDLARQIHAQTRTIKKYKFYLRTLLELKLALMVMACMNPQRARRIYQRHYPIWGGITNMNLNDCWPPRSAENPVTYFRAVSTGPISPLVLSLTTVQDTLHVGVSYRTTVFTPENVQRIIHDFVNTLNSQTNP
jgi:hypothetical protein